MNGEINISTWFELYTIMSFGKDRQHHESPIYYGIIDNFSNDTVFSNGVFVAFPEGGC
jgi:hypothetical protein